METFASHLGQVERGLEDELARVQQLARAASPSGSSAWDALLVAYQLDVPLPAQRQQWASELGQKQGACSDELRSVVCVLAQRLAWQLQQLGPGDPRDDASQSQLHQLRARQRRLVDEATQAYEGRVLPPRPAALGGIFAAAQATAPAPPAVRRRARAQLTLKCRHCGAPQQVSRSFDCPYCQQSVFD